MPSALMTLLILTLASEGVEPTALDAGVMDVGAAVTAVAARPEGVASSRARIAIDDAVVERWTRPLRFSGSLPADAAELRARLGARRTRELREANFHVRRFELAPGHDLTDDPVARERVEEILADGLVKLVRVSIEKAIDLERRVERLTPRRLRGSDDDRASARDTARGAPRGFRVSPNLWLGDDTAYGFRIRPRSAHPIWSRTSFELRQHTESGATRLRLKYARGDHLFLLEQRLGDRLSGDSFGLLVRTTF